MNRIGFIFSLGLLLILFFTSCGLFHKKSETKKIDPKALQLGIAIRVQAATDAEGRKIGKSFEDQLSNFEPCLGLGPAEIVRLKATYQIAKSGVIEAVKVTMVEPPQPQFSACFLKQIKHLDFWATGRFSFRVADLGDLSWCP